MALVTKYHNRRFGFGVAVDVVIVNVFYGFLVCFLSFNLVFCCYLYCCGQELYHRN